MNIQKFKYVIQSSHLNFLLGSGMSMPYIETLGNIENFMNEAEKEVDEVSKKIMQTILYAKYFNDVMMSCLPEMIETKKEKYEKVLANYKNFLKIWNSIIARRNVNILDKQINIFTTNIDNFTEKAAEEEGIEFNDGFKGRMNPVYREDTFANLISRTSTLYHNNSMVPVFNFMKMHGSINWGKEDNQITFSRDFRLLNGVKEKLQGTQIQEIIGKLKRDKSFEEFKSYVNKIENKKEIIESSKDFIKEYDKLILVNPRKTKYRDTVMELHFYELMRLLSNALEASSTILITLGFSFADEHIANIILRAANANPTLLVLVFVHEDSSAMNIKTNIEKAGKWINNNIEIVGPNKYKEWYEDNDKKELDGLVEFNFESLNKYVFEKLNELI